MELMGFQLQSFSKREASVYVQSEQVEAMLGLEDIPPAAVVDENLVGLVVIGDQVGNLSVCKDPLHC